MKGEQAESTALVEGGLFRQVSVDECTWTLEGSDNDLVHIYLEKSDSDIMWSAVIEGTIVERETVERCWKQNLNPKGSLSMFPCRRRR